MKRILLLDDSPTIQRVVTLSFAATKGYDVKCASNLETAKKYLAEALPDALIAYVRFSGDAKPEFFKALGVPSEQILLLAESRENLEPFEQAGFTQFVRKPFHTDDLKKAILSIIGDDSIRPEQMTTPSLNKTPPPPTFRPATTISMEALDRTFQKNNDAVPLPPAAPRTTTAVPPPPPPSMASQQQKNVPPPPPPPVMSPQKSVPHPTPEPTSHTHFSRPESDTQMRRSVPPPPPPVRRETQLQPLVSRSEQRQYYAPAEPSSSFEQSRYENEEFNAVEPQPENLAHQPQLTFNLAQATIADADARREVKDWVVRELPRIARDVVREELQKLLNSK